MLDSSHEASTPEDFGFPSNPTIQQLTSWRNQHAFLEHFRCYGVVASAAKAANVTVWAVERWDSTDLYGFKKRKQLAALEALGYIEDELNERIYVGYDRPVIHKGEITAWYKEKNSIDLMFRAKKLDPSYRDNYQSPGSNGNVTVTQININVHPSLQSDDNRHEVIEGDTPTPPGMS